MVKIDLNQTFSRCADYRIVTGRDRMKVAQGHQNLEQSDHPWVRSYKSFTTEINAYQTSTQRH
jgi:hypothetical protein